MARDQDARKHIDELHNKDEETIAFLIDRQQDRLNVVLDENARNAVLGHGFALLCYGILVRKHGAGSDAVPGWNDGNVVLELVEVVVGNVDGAVERVDEGGVVWAKGQLGDDVGKVEFCEN